MKEAKKVLTQDKKTFAIVRHDAARLPIKKWENCEFSFVTSNASLLRCHKNTWERSRAVRAKSCVYIWRKLWHPVHLFSTVCVHGTHMVDSCTFSTNKAGAKKKNILDEGGNAGDTGDSFYGTFWFLVLPVFFRAVFDSPFAMLQQQAWIVNPPYFPLVSHKICFSSLAKNSEAKGMRQTSQRAHNA